ncbi:hypothetical protein [Pleomorphovibrio marinus]|uniref:hypothetical protein n=1 Tax=Pleomorphovibrio marinus TaxID=2164132 RepID=UPI000E0A5E95|nr:hypothetical protein [Pleomorphovibrio marinus]
MKKKLNLFVVAVTLILGSCDDNLLEHQSSFERSQKAWFEFKNATGNSYTYTTTGASWVGGSWSTIITVDRGEVIRRSFSYTVFQDVMKPTTGWDEGSRNDILANMSLTADEFAGSFNRKLENVLEWQEEGEALGSHDPSVAAEMMTLDAIYDLSASNWLVRRENRHIYFEAHNNGMISLSGFVPNNCQDDCFIGIRIVEIAAL